MFYRAYFTAAFHNGMLSIKIQLYLPSETVQGYYFIDRQFFAIGIGYEKVKTKPLLCPLFGFTSFSFLFLIFTAKPLLINGFRNPTDHKTNRGCISNCRIPSLRGTKQSSIQRLHWIASTTSCLPMTLFCNFVIINELDCFVPRNDGRLKTSFPAV